MFGPFVLILLVLLLAMVCLHAAHDGWDGAEMQAVCVVIAVMLGIVIQLTMLSPPLQTRTVVRFDRGPPRLGSPRLLLPCAPRVGGATLPLRR